jgi:hypothetical protein
MLGQDVLSKLGVQPLLPPRGVLLLAPDRGTSRPHGVDRWTYHGSGTNGSPSPNSSQGSLLVSPYTDSSYFVKNGVRHAEFADVTEFDILKSGPLPPNTSAQLTELVVLTAALKQTLSMPS